MQFPVQMNGSVCYLWIKATWKLAIYIPRRAHDGRASAIGFINPSVAILVYVYWVSYREEIRTHKKVILGYTWSKIR